MFFYTGNFSECVVRTRYSSHDQGSTVVLCFDVQYMSSTSIIAVLPIPGKIQLVSTYDAHNIGSNYNYLDTLVPNTDEIGALPIKVNTVKKFIAVQDFHSYSSLLRQTGIIEPPASMMSVIGSMYIGYQFLFCELPASVEGFSSVVKVTYDPIQIFKGLSEYRMIPIASNLSHIMIGRNANLIPDRKKLPSDTIIVFREVPDSFRGGVTAYPCLYTTDRVNYVKYNLSSPRMFGDLMVPIVKTGNESVFLTQHHLNVDISGGMLSLS